MRTVILGAGIEGLTQAYLRLQQGSEVILIEKADRPGGLLRSFSIEGFHFDCAGHLLHTSQPRLIEYIEKKLSIPLLKVQRIARIFSKGVYTEYPFQTNTYGLPPEVIQECRQGLEKVQGQQPDCENFFNWILSVFGEGIARHFMIPYNQKLFCYPLERITCDWVNRYIPRPTLKEFDEGAKKRRISQTGYNAFFYYPRGEGIEVIVRRLWELIPQAQVLTSRTIAAIKPEEKRVLLTSGEVIEYDECINTIPLPELGRLIFNAPPEISTAFERLRWSGVKVINVGFEGDSLNDAHWIYFPEPEFRFYRVGAYHNINPKLCPPGHISFYVEYAFEGGRNNDIEIDREDLIEQLRRAGLINEGHRLKAWLPVRIPYAYVIFDKARKPALDKIIPYLKERGIHLAGRYGRWIYTSISDALMKLVPAQ